MRDTLGEVAGRLAGAGRSARSIGVTNQRETVVAWDRSTGAVLHRAVVWQDRRTAERCAAWPRRATCPSSASRPAWSSTPTSRGPRCSGCSRRAGYRSARPGPGHRRHLGALEPHRRVDGGVFATDVTNASRTMLFDIVVRRWSAELCDLFGVPAGGAGRGPPAGAAFGRVAPRPRGTVAPVRRAGQRHGGRPARRPVRPGLLRPGDDQGHLRHRQLHPDERRRHLPAPVDGLLTTLAWDLGTDGDVAIGADGGPRDGRGSVAYAVEGSVFVAGAGVQWLRDGLGVIAESAELEPGPHGRIVRGVVIVPAFTGLGSPHWDPGARGTITGLSRGIGRAHLARAMVEAMGFQVRDVLGAMAGTGTAPTVVRVDGGAAVMGLLLQHLADQAGLEVLRPRSVETTALGAATMAGLAEGVWGSLDDLAGLWSSEATFTPEADQAGGGGPPSWLRAVDRARGWVLPPLPPLAPTHLPSHPLPLPPIYSHRPPRRRDRLPSGQFAPAVVGQLRHDRDPLALPGPEDRCRPTHDQDHPGPRARRRPPPGSGRGRTRLVRPTGGDRGRPPTAPWSAARRRRECRRGRRPPGWCRRR